MSPLELAVTYGILAAIAAASMLIAGALEALRALPARWRQQDADATEDREIMVYKVVRGPKGSRRPL